MNGWVTLFSEPWIQRLGWVLIHFLWQGTGIALLLATVLRVASRASSHVRYVMIGSAFLLCAVLPVTTWIILGPQASSYMAAATVLSPTDVPRVESPVLRGSDPHTDGTMESPGNVQTRWQNNLSQVADASLPYVVGLWFGGVLTLTLRLTMGWMLMRRVCLSGLPIHDAFRLERFRGLLERMQVSVPVRLLESALVEVPTLIGWLRPTILVPVSVFMGLTPDQLEAILAHELAHVRRYDYLVNLFQTVIETILFYHPAIWWISRKLREERENCCDDIALEVMKDRLVYASALAQLEQGRGLPLALTASGGSLLQRIRRIAGVNEGRVSAWPLWLLVITLLLMACVAKSKTQTKQEDTATKSTLVAIVPPPQEVLIEAIAKNDSVLAAKALQDGAPLNTEAEYIHNGFIDQGTPLYFAAEKGEPDLVRMFVEHGASVKPGKSTWTNPLDAALRNGFPVVANYLHDHGATTDPLLYAAGTGDLGQITKLTVAGKPKNLDEAASTASGCGQVAALAALLGQGAHAEGAFKRAASTGAIESMQYLLGHGVDLKTVGYEALGRAAYHDKTEATAFLLKAGLSPNRQKQPTDTRFTEIDPPLNQAARAGAIGSVKLLLEAGADPNSIVVTDPGYGGAGNTPLCDACESDNEEIVRLLLDHGAGLETVTSGGFTPLLYAAYVHAPRCLALLLDRGANIKARNPNPNWNCGVLDFAAIFTGEDANRTGIEKPTTERLNRSMATVQVLLDHGMDINSTNREGFSLLSVAIVNGQSAWTEMLLRRGAKVNTMDQYGGTPLINAIRTMAQIKDTRFFAVLDELLARGADPNLGIDNPIGEKGFFSSALKTAIGGFGSKEMKRKTVNILLAHGACFSVPPGSDVEKMLLAATTGDIDAISRLLAKGVSPNVADGKGWTPLLSAAALEDDVVVKKLVEAGANVNAQDALGLNPVWFAMVRYPDLASFHLFMDKGANLNADSNFIFYDPPLYTAIMRRDPVLLADLLKHGASPNILPGDHPGRFEPLELAVNQLMEKFDDQERRDIVTMLIAAGANRNPKAEGYRQSLLFFPVANNMVDMAKFLLNAGIDPKKDADGGKSLSDELERHGTKEMRALMNAALAQDANPAK
jgi:ankyrin repeat protein/beta-lactamase regulating signal transducer with metallopeptidase domain